MDGLQDQKFNIRLVKTVKKYPLLYNNELKEYARRECRERAWIDVAEELNGDPKLLQKKWQNFRTLLVRKLKQRQMGETVQPYYLYDHLKFIMPYLRKSYAPEGRRRTSKKDIKKRDQEAKNQYETETDESIEENEYAMLQGNEIEDPIYLEEDETTHLNSQKEIKISNSSDEETEVCVEEGFKNNEIENKLNNAVSSNTFVKHAPICSPSTSAAADQVHSNRSHLEDIDNPKRQFVLSLLPDLKEMSNSQMRKFKCRVLLLVDEILKENELGFIV